MRCPICNEEVSSTEQAQQWGPEWAHSNCVTAFNAGKADASDELEALKRAISEAEPVAWVRWEWNRSGRKSLVFEKPSELPLAEEATGVIYDPLYTLKGIK